MIENEYVIIRLNTWIQVQVWYLLHQKTQLQESANAQEIKGETQQINES